MSMVPSAGDFITVDAFLAWMADIQNQINSLGVSQPRCRVSKSGTQTIPINTGTAITWDTESWDIGPIHSGSSSQLIAPDDRIYEGVLYGSWFTDTRGFRTILIRANGSTDVSAFKVEAEGSGPTLMTIPYEIFLSAGDYVQGMAYYESATGDPSTLTLLGASMTMRGVGTTT